ncbi:hypothetical protein ACH5RR_032304, partial [Cinchona calisaya]
NSYSFDSTSDSQRNKNAQSSQVYYYLLGKLLEFVAKVLDSDPPQYLSESFSIQLVCHFPLEKS